MTADRVCTTEYNAVCSAELHTRLSNGIKAQQRSSRIGPKFTHRGHAGIFITHASHAVHAGVFESQDTQQTELACQHGGANHLHPRHPMP